MRPQLALLRASDLQASVTFYRDLVGIPLKPGDNNRPGDPWIGGTHFEYSWRTEQYFHFSIYPGNPSKHTAGAHLGFRVDELELVHQRLIQGNAPVLHPPRVEPWGLTARYADPDGNVVELVQPARARG
jgi:catechol 2,3-dioxygenase-like lactoylglutathione lyase family enzyme